MLSLGTRGRAHSPLTRLKHAPLQLLPLCPETSNAHSLHLFKKQNLLTIVDDTYHARRTGMRTAWYGHSTGHANSTGMVTALLHLTHTLNQTLITVQTHQQQPRECFLRHQNHLHCLGNVVQRPASSGCKQWSHLMGPSKIRAQ